MKARIWIPGLRVSNLSNVRMHRMAKAMAIAETREEVTFSLADYTWPDDFHAPTAERPLDVLLVRHGPRELDDDGVVCSLKPVRDAVAAFIGVDDKHKALVKYAYDQKPGEYAVEIHISSREVA